MVAPSLGFSSVLFFSMSRYCNYWIIPIGFENLRRADLHATYLRILSSKFKLIWSSLFELLRVFLLGYTSLLMSNVAGKYLDRKYAHNVYNCTRRSHTKDEERFRNGFVRDLNIRTLNKCTRSIF